MKTITLWNIPLPVAKETARIMRDHIAEVVKNGADTDQVYDLMYNLARIESDILISEKDE